MSRVGFIFGQDGHSNFISKSFAVDILGQSPGQSILFGYERGWVAFQPPLKVQGLGDGDQTGKTKGTSSVVVTRECHNNALFVTLLLSLTQNVRLM